MTEQWITVKLVKLKDCRKIERHCKDKLNGNYGFLHCQGHLVYMQLPQRTFETNMPRKDLDELLEKAHILDTQGIETSPYASWDYPEDHEDLDEWLDSLEHDDCKEENIDGTIGDWEEHL